MTASQPAAVLRPTGWAHESVGDLRLDTIRGIWLWLPRSADYAALTARYHERWNVAGAIDSASGGKVTVHVAEWQVEAIRDERAREWRVTLTVPAEAAA